VPGAARWSRRPAGGLLRHRAITLADGRTPDPPDIPVESEVARLRQPQGAVKYILIASTILAILAACNQLFNLHFAVGAILLQNQYYYLLIAILLPLAFILFPARIGSDPGTKVPWYDIVLALVAFFACLYLVWIGRKIVEAGWEFGVSAGAPWHLFLMSFVMWGLLTEALRRSSGWGLMFSVSFFAFYPVFADKLPGPISGIASSLPDTATYHITSAESMLGAGLTAFAELVIGFLVFGAALQYTGAGPFFINLALALLGSVRGGPAKVAIFSSGLLGSMSGSVVSNVLTTGPITIPAMKRSGVRPSTAGAIEACAATGAAIIPPVMGATAFVMASFLGVPYSAIALAAVVPAALYYFGLYMQIDCYAAQNNLQGLPRHELPRLGETLRKGWHYLIVIAFLVWMLLVLKRESQAPFYATALLIIIHQIFGGSERWGWKEL
jgi:TRAP transporter 4TM/12TM fusion protein